MALHTLQRRLRQLTFKRKGNTCWPWLGRIDSDGNGTIWGINTYVSVPRALMLVKYDGQLPEGVRPLSCPILKDCANPDHISLATPSEIVDRILWKKRQQRVKKKPQRIILSDEIVRQVYLSTGGCVAVAKEFGMSPSHVVNIRAGKKHAKVTRGLDREHSSIRDNS